MATTVQSFLLGSNSAGITSLKLPDDRYDTDYIWQGQTLGDVVVRYRIGGGDWHEARAFASGDIRTTTASDGDDPDRLVISYPGGSRGVKSIRDFQLTVEFDRLPEALYWRLLLQNPTDQAIEIGDIALPLPFNNQFMEGNVHNYTRVVARHSFISGHGSFIFWMRPNGAGPYLLMTPLDGTGLEYYECHEQSRQGIQVPYWVYIHSAAQGGAEQRGAWRQPHTAAVLAPRGEPGSTLSYGFKLQWVPDYDGVRDGLYREGLFDVQVVPGMTVPRDLQALVSIRTSRHDYTVEPEYPDETRVEDLGERQPDTHIYRVTFSRLGENLLTVRYGDDRYMVLEFFVCEPLETLIRKRAAFLVDKQQHRDPATWWNGLFSVWDMRSAILRGPDNTDGFDYWWGYVLACDDTALPKAPYIAAKNLHFPNQAEIAALEYYLEHFVWGGLQRTDREEPFPYGIYGVPNWFENRNSEHGFGTGGRGQEHLWRSYDYPHIMMLYYHMYQIARQYPSMTHYLDAAGYLQRAFGTAKAYFTLQNLRPDSGAAGYRSGHWAYTQGIYNDLLLVDLIADLQAEGLQEQADWLRQEWEKKVKYFVYDNPYPFDSEYPFDTTAFETSHAIARYGLSHTIEPDENLWFHNAAGVWYSHPEVRREDFAAFMEKQIQANIALRGWLEPAYYLLGGDFRGGDGTKYGLSYMSQLAGWSIVDYALYFSDDPYPYLRLGYASFLSSWALMNSGTAESNYGYWYPGEENDGASGWAFTPEKYGSMWIRKDNQRGAWFYDGEIEIGYIGALRTAATVVADDPLFGLVAYGGLLTQRGDTLEVIPRDGLRKRFHLLRGAERLHLLLDWDGFAEDQPIVLSGDLSTISFTVENRTRDEHVTTLRIDSLRPGTYLVQGQPAGGSMSVHVDGETCVRLQIGSAATYPLSITRIKPD